MYNSLLIGCLFLLSNVLPLFAQNEVPATYNLKEIVQGTPNQVLGGHTAQIMSPLKHELDLAVPLLRSKDSANYYATLQHLPEGLVGSVGDQPATFVHLEKVGELGTVFGLQFQPDVQSLYLLAGNAFDQFSQFNIYSVDLANKQMQFVTKRLLRYGDTQTSPDGQYAFYIAGGDAYGNSSFMLFGEEEHLEPRTLYVDRLKTQKETSIIQEGSLGRPQWMAPHTLLYDYISLALVEKEQKQIAAAAQKNPATPPAQGVVEGRAGLGKPMSVRPDIYSFSPDTGQTKLLVKDGTRVLPSPDGHQLAFFGSEDPLQPVPWRTSNNPGGAALCISHADGSERRALNVENDTFPKIHWSPDNRHLFWLKPISKQTQELREWDTQTGHFRVIANLDTTQLTPTAENKVNEPSRASNLSLSDVSPDGQDLLIEATLAYFTGNPTTLVLEPMVYEVNVKTGNIRPLLSFPHNDKVGGNVFFSASYSHTQISSPTG